MRFWLTGAVLALCLLIIAVVLVLNSDWYLPAAVLPQSLVTIKDQTVQAELATTPAQMYQGLSGRPALCPACAMLFNFSDSAERQFVMRNMAFPLDIIFISYGHIIKIDANLPPDGAGPEIVYDSGAPADQVLEVNAGYAAAHGIKVGDAVSSTP